MTTLPNPFDSGCIQASPDEAAALSVPTPPDAAADIPETSATERRIEEAPAATSTVTVAAGDVGATNHIGEIFVGAAKLVDADTREISLSELCDRGFDVHAFIDAIDPMPLFLQRIMA